MSYYEDLAPCKYFGPNNDKLIAVGWLAPEHEYARGDIDAEFFRALVRLLADPWQPVITAGAQKCFLCRFTGGPASLQYESATIGLGSTNLFVPTERQVYVAPSLIAHYIDAHQYAPPREYQDAVLGCPAMRSMAYLQLLSKHHVYTASRDSYAAKVLG